MSLPRRHHEHAIRDIQLPIAQRHASNHPRHQARQDILPEVSRPSFGFQEIPVALVPLVSLHISSATFTFYEDENFKDDEQDQQLQALKKYGQGMIHFVDCMQQILDKVMRLKCDDGSSHLRKDIFNVDKLVVKWCALTSMEDTTLCLRVHWDDIKYRDVEQRMVGGKCVETTWNRYYASTGYGAERQILAYSRDLTNH